MARYKMRGDEKKVDEKARKKRPTIPVEESMDHETAAEVGMEKLLQVISPKAKQVLLDAPNPQDKKTETRVPKPGQTPAAVGKGTEPENGENMVHYVGGGRPELQNLGIVIA